MEASTAPLILVVDDDPRHARGLAARLDAVGYRARTADDSVTALAAVDTERPDLILLDVKMPGVDGLDFCRYVKTALGGFAIPVVIVTGYHDAAARAVETGADGFLAKPVALAELLAEVRRHLACRLEAAARPVPADPTVGSPP